MYLYRLLGWLFPIKVTYWRFQSSESQFKNSYQFRLTTSWNRLSPEDGFRLLVSSNSFLRFLLVVRQALAYLGKSASRIWPFSVSHLPGLGRFLNWLYGDWKTPVSHFDWTKLSQKSLSRSKWFYAPHAKLYHENYTKNLPGLQFIIPDWMSLSRPQNRMAGQYL